MNRITVICILSIHLLLSRVLAENGTVRGQIFCNEGAHVANVNISFDYNNHAAVSRDDGSFVISSVPSGTYLIRVTHIGFYEIILANVVVTAGDTIDLGMIVLESKIDELQPTVVTSGIQEQKGFNAPGRNIGLSFRIEK